MAQVNKFRRHFFAFTSSWTKVAQTDKLEGRQCILLINKKTGGVVPSVEFFFFWF